MKHSAGIIMFLARVYGWQLLKNSPQLMRLDFIKDGCHLTVWNDRMTVRTVLQHPIMGVTELFRKNVDLPLFESILDNPRVHTKRGYIRRISRPKRV